MQEEFDHVTDYINNTLSPFAPCVEELATSLKSS